MEDSLEVFDEAWRDWMAASPGRSAAGQQHAVKHAFPHHFLGVIESAHIEKLPQQLQSWLGAEPVRTRHVEVIDEDEHFLALRGAQDVASALDEFADQLLLRSLRRAVCAEVEGTRKDARASSGPDTRWSAAKSRFCRAKSTKTVECNKIFKNQRPTHPPDRLDRRPSS